MPLQALWVHPTGGWGARSLSCWAHTVLESAPTQAPSNWRHWDHPRAGSTDHPTPNWDCARLGILKSTGQPQLGPLGSPKHSAPPTSGCLNWEHWDAPRPGLSLTGTTGIPMFPAQSSTLQWHLLTQIHKAPKGLGGWCSATAVCGGGVAQQWVEKRECVEGGVSCQFAALRPPGISSVPQLAAHICSLWTLLRTWYSHSARVLMPHPKHPLLPSPPAPHTTHPRKGEEKGAAVV